MAKQIILLTGIILFSASFVFSQHISKDNYTGNWETPASWSPTWAVPETNISGYDITINGYITINSSLSFSGNGDNLIVNDTLVIIGDLSFANKNNLTINDNGIVIVRGSITLDNQCDIKSNAYLIVTGDLIQNGSVNQGSLTSNDNPVKVFIGGVITPPELTNQANFPALNCASPPTTPYPNSMCSYGNFTDLENDPIYPFFQSTCIATPTIAATGPTTFCAGGSVTLTSSTGSSYIWSTGESTQSISVTSSGNYTVQITSPSGCLSVSSLPVTVNVNALPSTPTISAGGPTTFCQGGSVTLTSSAGSSYLWSTGATTQSIIVSASGNYTVRVTNVSGCQSAASVATMVTVNPLPTAPSITAGGPTTFCNGGSVTLSASTGFAYLWSTGETTQSINVTTSGNYSARITNVNGCQSPASATTSVTVNPLPSTPTISADGPTTFCDGGSVNLTSVTGTSYIWSTGATTQSINVTSSGNYTVQVTNANGCQSQASAPIAVTVNSLPTTPTITAGGPTTFCSGGNVTLTSSTGNSYLWSTGASTPNINVTSSGNYTVIVTNTSGCVSTTSVPTIVTVNALPVASITANGPTTFCAGGNVTLTSNAASGYLWSNAATTQSISVNNTGSYTVQVMNANGCQSAASSPTTVTVNSLPWVNAGTDATILINTSTTINATVTGTGPFTYSWVPSSLLENATVEVPTTVNLATTTVYTLTATSSATTCSNSGSVTITVSGGTLTSTPTATPGTVCSGMPVQLRAIASGGSGIYTYSWTSTPPGFTSSNANPTVNPTTTTTYDVIVNDGTGNANSQVTVTVNDLPATPTITAGGPITFCAGNSVTLTSSGGSSDTYLWSNAANTSSINITESGTYTVQVSDANGCRSAASAPTIVTVNALPSIPTISAAGPTTFCDGGNLTLTSSAGSSFLWSTGETTATINASSTGNYSVAVSNASGCQSPVSMPVAVTVNALPPTPVITASGPTTFCDGGNVVLTSSVATSYLWSNAASSPGINVSSAGSYSLRVTNSNGCLSAQSLATVVTVNALPGTPTITATGPTTFCNGSSLTLTSSAGLSYLWSNASTTESVNITESGTYTVQVANANGCLSPISAPTVVTVNTLPSIPTITASGSTTFCDGESVTLTSSAGSSFLWSTGETTESINTSASGNYSVIVVNSEGCQSSASTPVLVTVNPLPLVTAGNNGPICSGSSLALTGGTSGLSTYSWTGVNQFSSLLQNPVISTSATPSMSGDYTLAANNAYGCTNTAVTTVVVNDSPLVSITSSDASLCINDTRALTGSPDGGTFIITSGDGSITNNTLLATGAGTINLAYNISNTCANTGLQTITVSEVPTANAGQDQELEFDFRTHMNADLSLTETGEWSLISGTGIINDIYSPSTLVTGLSGGENIFQWKVTIGSCFANDEVIVKVNDLFLPSVITPNNDGKNDYFKINYTGRVALFIFNQWGNQEYSNNDYSNDWDGKNNKGKDLPNDTYFYILKFENGYVKKGSILIKR